MQNTKKKLIIIGAAVLAVLLAAALLLWHFYGPKTQDGGKKITFELVQADGASKEYRISTQKAYLADALAEIGLVDYQQGGLYDTIAGIKADWSVDQGWWKISRDGTALSVGMNEQPIADGEHYEATYTRGY